MSDNMNLVEHVRRNKNGLTKMQIQIPISTRAGMAELSKRLGISQLAIVRSALAAFLVANEASVAPLVAPEVLARLPLAGARLAAPRHYVLEFYYRSIEARSGCEHIYISTRLRLTSGTGIHGKYRANWKWPRQNVRIINSTQAR